MWSKLVIEKELVKDLLLEGITMNTLKVMEEQEITSFRAFNSLKHQHFDQLAKYMKLGRHAILVMWEKQV